MMNDMYVPNGSQSGQPGTTQYAQPMPGMATGYDSLFQILWRGRWLILLSLVLAGAGAYVYLRETTPMYESASQLLVEKPSAQPRSDVPQPVGSTSGNYLATQASLLTSPEVITAALRDPNMIALPTFADPGYVQRVVGTLSAGLGKKGDIILVKASSEYPADAAQIVNAVVRAYTRWHEANRQLTTADLLKDLNAQLDNRYRDLQAKRKEQLLFEQRNPQVVENTPGTVFSKTLDVLKQELVSARLAAVERESYYQGLQRFEKEPEKLRSYITVHQAITGVATDDAEPARLKEELRTIQQQLETFAAASVATQRSQIALLQNRQAETEKKIAASAEQYVQNHVAMAKALAEDARAREKQLNAMYEKEFAKVQTAGDQDSQYAFLKSECEMMERLCNSLLNQINQLDLNARFEGLRVHVLAKAVPAKAPSSPQVLRVIGIALVLGLMVGAGLSLLRDWRDQRIRSQEEITALLGAPILGAIPSIPRRAIARGQKLRFVYGSRESEACRAIRTALLCGMRREEARTILVTSPGPAEGKTLLVSHLAMAMAQAGQKTLILDADLRKPRNQRVFQMNGHSTGLVDVLMGTADLRGAIRATEIGGLDVLESGQSTPNPSELLNAREFAQMLEQLKREYDRILVDSPPVGVVTDAQILATLCDSTLLVLRAEESSRILTQRARDALYAVGARVAGVVVNDVSRRGSRHSYYSGYGYYYSHQGSNGHKTAREEPPIGGNLQGENESLAPEKNENRREPAGQEPPVDAGARLEKEVLSLEIKEYNGKSTRGKPWAEGGPQAENGASTSQKRKNGRKGAASGLSPNGDPSPENRVSGVAEDGNGRQATSAGLVTNCGSPSEKEASAPEKREEGGGPTGEEPPTGMTPSREKGDQAAQRWKEWLRGQK